MFSFEEIFDLVDIGITVYEPLEEGNDFKVVYINDKAKKFCRFDVGESVSEALSTLYPVNETRPLIEFFREVYRTGEAQEIALVPCFGFTNLWQEGYIYKLSSGHLVSRCLGVKDERAREILAPDERLTFRTILDTAPIGIWSQDVSGRLRFVNKAFCDATGISEERFLSVPHYEPLYSPEAAKSCMRSDAAALQQSEPHLSYEKIPFTDGKVHEVLIVKTRVEDESHGVSGLVGLSLDITEQLEAERKLEAINRNLEERIREEIEASRRKDTMLFQQNKFAAMGEMISNIAHQWRQPLNTLGLLMTGMSVKMMMAQDDTRESEFEAFQSHCSEIIQYLSDTIDDFRLYYQEDGGHDSFCISDMDKSLHTLVISSIMGNRIRYENDLENVRISGHLNNLKQALINLYSNAANAIKSNGTEAGFIQCRGFVEGSQYVIKVCDNGGGIDKAIIDKIFDPYFTTKHKSQGTGLGLYMTRQIIEQKFSGTITVKNEKAGACFTIRLPFPGEAC
ncbi:PAS domain-containing sensor histidine kinase [Sulfurimonas diazotrophicus]|uniref:histidine kinase n=1 Tax=Sulfurimonas diazotrophicus TaxID=3131939 RepID=A0ABZ3HCD3_9BACT